MALSLLNRLGVPPVTLPKLAIYSASSIEYQQVRFRVNNKHKDPKFRNLRRLKVMTPDPLPMIKPFLVSDTKLDTDYWWSRPQPFRVWNERDIYVSTSNVVLDEFIPPEDDASRTSILEKGKNLGNYIKDTGKDKLAVRKIRQYDQEFNVKLFAEEAKDIYIAAHECLASGDEKKLTEYVTEMARTAMLMNGNSRTIRWKYLQSLEPPSVVQVRQIKLDGDDDLFAQATVRFHSQQVLAVYDRFGRLLYGSEILAKDVLEYVVFEKHISNEYGIWRVHAKIIPDCVVKPAEHTYVKSQEDQGEGLTASEAPVEAVEVVSDNPPPKAVAS